MSFIARWGRPGVNETVISDVRDLEVVLDKAAADAASIPLLVHVDSPAGGVEVVVGHPIRAALAHVDHHSGSRVHAVQRNIEPLGWQIQVDVDGQFRGFSPVLTRIRPEIARQAVTEFVITGQRPACVAHWIHETNPANP